MAFGPLFQGQGSRRLSWPRRCGLPAPLSVGQGSPGTQAACSSAPGEGAGPVGEARLVFQPGAVVELDIPSPEGPGFEARGARAGGFAMERPFGEGPRRPGQNATKRETIFHRRPAGRRRRQGNLGFISFLTSSLSCGDAPVGAGAGRGGRAKPYRGREQPGPRRRASTHPVRPGLRFCLRWKTGTQERLGKVPGDPWPGRDGRAFAVHLISRRPPHPTF